MTRSSQSRLASSRRAATATRTFAEAKTGPEAATTRHAPCTTSHFTIRGVTSCHWVWHSSKKNLPRNWLCGATIMTGPIDNFRRACGHTTAYGSFSAFEEYNGCLQISMKPSKRQPQSDNNESRVSSFPRTPTTWSSHRARRGCNTCADRSPKI